MAENFSVSELIVPGVFVRVRAEGLIRAGGISSGNIGIVGTASSLADGQTVILSDYDAARASFGEYDAYLTGESVTGTLNLVRSLQLIYQNGGRTVYARALAAAAARTDYEAAFAELLKDDINIVLAPELSYSDAVAVFGSLLESAENDGKDLIAIVGSELGGGSMADFLSTVPDNDRLIVTAPGVVSYDAAASEEVALAGTYTAAAVAGLISSLVPQSSPTNKALPGLTKLAQRFSYGELKALVSGRVLALEERQGVKVVRGITTESGAFQQITTRRIVDAAKQGIRKSSEPFIGKLNNARVRKALQGAIASFLDGMVGDEALTTYSLEVTATRDDEIGGRAVVNAVLQPTFSIDYIAVTLNLQ